MGVAAQGRQAAYGARPKESRKLMAVAARITEVASAKAMAREIGDGSGVCGVVRKVRGYERSDRLLYTSCASE